MSIPHYIFILIIHFYADFALQTHDQAINKSSSIKWLTYHILSYSLTFSVAFYILSEDILKCLIFFGITFICHWITDYVTSRIGKPFWEKKDFHNGFVVVGADQVLHYTQLILTFNWLLNN